MAPNIMPTEVLFVGSSPLASCSEFFSTVAKALPTSLQRIPDGETGPRSNFIAWQHSTIPIEIMQPRWGGQPSATSNAKKYKLQDIKPLGYDDQAIASYQIFATLRAGGTIPPYVRFQVSLPTPLNVVRGFVENDAVCAQIEPLYEERMLQCLRHIQDRIPASDLSIQWDLPTEIAVLEHERGKTDDKYWKPYFAPVKAGVLTRLTRLASAVDPGVQMGYHICYGDFNHVHFVYPPDMGLMVDLANAIATDIEPIHHVEYIHLPVPKDRADDAYYRPLESLHLSSTKLFLGLIHVHDREGTEKRLGAAHAVYPNIAGVATECGMGRTPLEDISSILEIAAGITYKRL